MTKYFLFVAFVFTGLSGFAASEPHIIRSFHTDGCTDSPDGTWRHCCVEHDISYWAGGSFNDRKATDQRLAHCMDLSGGEHDSSTYYQGVRIFGTNDFGSAWPPRDLNTLSEQEREDIRNELELYASIGYPLDFEFIRRESIMYQPLTPAQKKLIRESLSVYAQTDEYKEYLKTYEDVTGEEPTWLKFLK
jgi:hypothetical protein